MFKFVKSVDFYNAYSRFLPFVKPYWFLAILGIILTAPVGALDACVAWFLKPFMDNVMVQKEQEFTQFTPFIIVGFTIIQGFFIYMSSWVNGYVGGKITLDIRRKLYDKLLKMDCAYFDSANSGLIIFRYFNDAEMASGGLISNKIKYIMTKTVSSGAYILTIYNETSGVNKVIKSYTLRNKMKQNFEKSAVFLFDLGMRLIKETNWLSPLMHIVASVGVAIVIAVGGHLIIEEEISSGTFVSFIAALIMLYTPLKSIGNNYIEVQKSIIDLDRIYDIFGSKPIEEKEDEKNLTKITDFKNTIEFRNINFSYQTGRKVLNGITFTIKKSQTIALVGNSGGGKSSICSLLPRLYEWQSGDILIDGVSIKNYSLESLRSQISYVFQDNFLFEGTLRENILLGKENSSEEELQASIKNACLDEFISSLPKGLDTQIGERGMLLSGGQKQRVAIARAFIKNAPIVILDEATSALDNKSEKVVQEALNNLMKDRTVIVIAHRLTTIQNADNILVINNGNIVEQGVHSELIGLNGAYASLYNSKLVVEKK